MTVKMGSFCVHHVRLIHTLTSEKHFSRGSMFVQSLFIAAPKPHVQFIVAVQAITERFTNCWKQVREFVKDKHLRISSIKCLSVSFLIILGSNCRRGQRLVSSQKHGNRFWGPCSSHSGAHAGPSSCSRTAAVFD